MSCSVTLKRRFEFTLLVQLLLLCVVLQREALAAEITSDQRNFFETKLFVPFSFVNVTNVIPRELKRSGVA